MKLGSSVIQDKKKKVNTKQENGKEKKKMSTFHDLKASEAV